MHARTAAALTAAALLAVTACSSNDNPSSTATTDRPSSTTTGSTPGPESIDAESIVKQITGAIDDAKAATVYTAATDPNHLLGRPSGYTSKADWTDRRAKPKIDDEVQNGGSIEVYTDPTKATERSKFILDMLDKMKIFGTEYHHLSGGILLRVSGALTPDQAAEYEAVLGKLS